MKIIYRWKILAADFFNKVPTVILVPAVLLISFLAAAFLIWAGIKLAPVSIREPADPYESKGNNNSSKLPSEGGGPGDSDQQGYSDGARSSGNAKRSELTGENRGLNKSGDSSQQGRDEAQRPESAGSGGLNRQGESSLEQSIDSSVSDDGINTTNKDQKSSSSSSSGSSKENNSNNSSSGSSTFNDDAAKPNESTSENCTYPEGDVKIWWSRATRKQRDCYISRNGPPNFGKDTPYFCDYESNEDCYYK